MKKLVFAAIAMMVMVSASNSFATKSATSMKGYNTAVADTTDTTKTEPVADTTKDLVLPIALIRFSSLKAFLCM